MKEDILKEAIADAEKIRTVAFENAKLALEEAFQPRLQQMISAKIKEEIGDEDDETMNEDADDEEEISNDEEIAAAEEPTENPDSVDIPIGGDDDEEAPEGVTVNTDEETGDTTVDVKPEEGEAVNVAVDGEDIDLTIDPEEGETEPTEEVAPEDGEEINVDELENEPVDEDVDINLDLEDENEGEVDEDIDINIDSEDEAGPDDEDINLDLEPEDDDEIKEVVKVQTELTETKTQLDKAYEVVEVLRGKLNEINLLNSKLLYSNKIFRAYALNNDAKTKIIESIDRAKTVREAKLIYQTLTETIASKTEKKAPKPFVKTITENIASAKIASTKPSKIINENNDPYTAIKLRNQKLAGIID